LPRPQSRREVCDVRRLVFATEEYIALGSLTPSGRGTDFLDEKGNALRRVINGKGLSQNISVAVAAESHVLVLGVIKRDAEHFARVCCPLNNANELRQQAAILLASTPYAMLTSIPGIGFTLAAGMAGELGDPLRLSSVDSLCAFAGIVPRTFQSGGPDQPASQGHTPARCNRILKDWAIQSAQKIHLYGPPELKDRISRWKANGQHGIFAGARRYLRLLRSLVLNQVPYLDPQSRSSLASEEDRANAALNAWLILVRKWRTIPDGLALISKETNPLGFWRRVAMESRSVHLPLRP